jgi:hypothetical protein
MDPSIAKEIESFRRMTVAELKTRYAELFGEPSPSSNRAHLFRRVAWRLQARAGGELSERARQRAAALAEDADLRWRAPRSFWRTLDQQTSPGVRRDPRLPLPGAVLTRVYQQQSIAVKVLETGFDYNGKVYASLSAVAYQITGTRWNGFLFFGLHRGKRHGRTQNG